MSQLAEPLHGSGLIYASRFLLWVHALMSLTDGIWPDSWELKKTPSSSSYFWPQCFITGQETIRHPLIDSYAWSGNYHTNLCFWKFNNFKPTYDWDHTIFGICTVSLNIMAFRFCHIIPNNRIYQFLK